MVGAKLALDDKKNPKGRRKIALAVACKAQAVPKVTLG